MKGILPISQLHLVYVLKHRVQTVFLWVFDPGCQIYNFSWLQINLSQDAGGQIPSQPMQNGHFDAVWSARYVNAKHTKLCLWMCFSLRPSNHLNHKYILGSCSPEGIVNILGIANSVNNSWNLIQEKCGLCVHAAREEGRRPLEVPLEEMKTKMHPVPSFSWTLA